MAAVISEVSTFLVREYVTYASSAMLAYEYLRTFEDERTLVWKRRWTASTAVLFSNRTMMLAYACVPLLQFTSETCKGAVRYLIQAIELLPYVVIACFSGLRVYALSGRSVMLTTLVAVLSLGPIATNMYVDAIQPTSTTQAALGPLNGVCLGSLPISAALNSTLAILSRVTVICADAIVAIVTWYTTFRHAREAVQLGINVKVTATLLRDGSLYFVVLLLLNLAQLLVEVVNQWTIAATVASVNQAITFFLVSQFIINLCEAGEVLASNQETSHSSLGFQPSAYLTFSLPGTSNILGNMGESLDHTFRDEPWTDEDTTFSGTTYQPES